MQKLGCCLVELAPGKRAWPYHLHYGQEELFFIIEGQGSLRYDDTMRAVRAGDVIFTPVGEGTAHQIINTSEKPLKYLAMSSREDPEICYYPDSGKFGSYVEKRPAGVRFIASAGSHVDYWQGE